MAHSKKSRKVGKIGVSKANTPRPVKIERKNRKTSGNKSGTRQQLESQEQANASRVKKDPKLGSKTPIDLNKYKDGAVSKPAKAEKPIVYKTPREELEAIENNQELDALLEKQLEQKLSRSEQAFVDKLSARYRDLCELLGISVDADPEDDDLHDEQENEDLDDPFARLDAIKIDDFKD